MEKRKLMQQIAAAVRALAVGLMILCAGVFSENAEAAAYKSNESMYTGTRVISVVPVTTSAGFNPSSGNSLEMRTTYALPTSGTIRVRFAILNSKGEWVYKKIYNAVSGNFMIRYWNGKPSSGNKAKLSTSSYVPDGTYTLAVTTFTTSGVAKSRRTHSFKVSRSAPSGKSGVTKRSLKPAYVGYGCMDYLAELMIKAAGVKSTDSANAKVKKIYAYMTKNFKHVHDLSTRAEQYKISKLTTAITNYNAEIYKACKNGHSSFMYPSWVKSEQTSMIRRGGQCNDHARIFDILCWHVGVPAGYCTGYYKNSNGTLAGHYWPYAIINGTKYYYDVDIEIQNLGKGQGDFYWYKWSQAKADTKYIFNSTYTFGA